MNLKGTFKQMMNSYMEAHANDDEEILKKYKSQYNSLIELIKTVLGGDAFSLYLNSEKNSMELFMTR